MGSPYRIEAPVNAQELSNYWNKEWGISQRRVGELEAMFGAVRSLLPMLAKFNGLLTANGFPQEVREAHAREFRGWVRSLTIVTDAALGPVPEEGPEWGPAI
jgi:hypothetical protein